MFADVSKLAYEMKEKGIGRVSFDYKIINTNVRIFFITDMGKWTILVSDVDKIKPNFKFVSENNDSNFYIPIEYWRTCASYFNLNGKYDTYAVYLAYNFYFLDLCDDICMWLKTLRFPTIKEANMVDYTELPMLVFGGKRRYFYMFRKAAPKPQSTEKTSLAFGKNMAEFMKKNGLVISWTDRKRKEKIEKIGDIVASEKWFKCIDEKDDSRFVRYNDL